MQRAPGVQPAVRAAVMRAAPGHQHAGGPWGGSQPGSQVHAHSRSLSGGRSQTIAHREGIHSLLCFIMVARVAGFAVCCVAWGQRHGGPHPRSACHACRVVGTILTWLVSPFVLGGGAVILAFLLLVTQGQRTHFRRDREKLRAEFEAYRRQMQAKVPLFLRHSRLIRSPPEIHGRVRGMQLMDTGHSACAQNHVRTHAPWPVHGWHCPLLYPASISMHTLKRFVRDVRHQDTCIEAWQQKA